MQGGAHESAAPPLAIANTVNELSAAYGDAPIAVSSFVDSYILDACKHDVSVPFDILCPTIAKAKSLASRRGMLSASNAVYSRRTYKKRTACNVSTADNTLVDPKGVGISHQGAHREWFAGASAAPNLQPLAELSCASSG